MLRAECLRFIDRALTELGEDHEQGVIHGNIRTASVILLPDGTVSFADAGDAAAEPDYLSPEQVESGAEPDARSDIYSLGVVMYEALTGRRPYSGEDRDAAQPAPAPPMELDPTISSDLGEIVLMAIARNPAKRFQSVRALQQAFRSVAGDDLETGAVPEPAPEHRQGGRLKYMIIGALAVVVVVVLAMTQLANWLRTEAKPEPTAAAEPVSSPPPVNHVDAAATPEAPEEPASVSSDVAPPAPLAPVPVAKPRPTRNRPEPVPAPPPPKPLARTAAVVPAAPPAPSPVQSSRAELEAALDAQHERLTLMATRIAAVNSGLDKLEQEQAAMGLSLRGDITSARQRMEFRMDQAEAAIENSDPDGARKSLDLAERDLEKIEKFLNI